MKIYINLLNKYKIIIIILLTIFLFLVITGTLNSGFHFTDDHEIIKISQDLQKDSFINVVIKWILIDLKIRFRPMYYFVRVLCTKLFEVNFFIWSVYTGLLAFITMISFYYGMRNLKFSTIESLIFISLTFIGSQMSIWWRLGPSETIGVTFLGIGFYFMSKYNERKMLNTFFFSLFLIFSSLSKESFTIIIPAFIYLKLYIEKNEDKISFYETIKKNYLVILPLLIFISSILFIIFFVGTNTIGYAGLDSSIFQTVKGAFKIIKNPLRYYVIIILLLLLFIYYELKNEKSFMEYLKSNYNSFIFCILILLPNLYLYSKSGIFERYFIPVTIGIAYLITSILRSIKLKYHWLYSLFIVIIFLFLSTQLYTSLKTARSFAKEGMQTNEFLSAVINNSSEESILLVVTDPVKNYEWSYSLREYLSINKRPYLYGCAITNKYKDAFSQGLERSWYSFFENRTFEDMKNNPDGILFLNKKVINDIEECEFNLSDYTNIINSNSSFAYYIKK